MLSITQELISHLYHSDSSGQSPALSSCFINAILKCGSQKDAEALLPVFLEKPDDFYRKGLLPIMAKFGNKALAQQLFESCFDAAGLKAGMAEEVMEVLGQLKYEPAEAVLCSYALSETSGYYTSMPAVLGLLHFSCEAYEQQIEQAIRNTLGKNVFNEFVPSLVCKLKNKQELLPALYEHGSNECSTDCNGGILLGLALSGVEGTVYFRKALLDPLWETDSPSTGTVYWASLGMDYAGIGFIELYAALPQETDKEQLAFKLRVLKNLLVAKIGGSEEILFAEGHAIKESLPDIFKSLYSWETPNKRNNIMDLAQTVGQEDDYFELENLLLRKIEEEYLLRCL